MNKEELIAAVAQKAKSNKKDAKKFLNSLIQVTEEELSNGNRIQITGFGTFYIHKRGSYKGRNPKTGESLNIPARKSIKFSTGKYLLKTIRKDN